MKVVSFAHCSRLLVVKDVCVCSVDYLASEVVVFLQPQQIFSFDDCLFHPGWMIADLVLLKLGSYRVRMNPYQYLTSECLPFHLKRTTSFY